MSKVVHLADEAHALAKQHCKERGLRMSDWVAELIRRTVSEVSGHTSLGVADSPTVGSVQAKPAAPAVEAHQASVEPASRELDDRPGAVSRKRLPRMEDGANVNGEPGADPYEAPPFWERKDAS